MTHNKTPGVFITIRGHTLTVLEGHALIYGSVGFLVALSQELRDALRHEFHYVLASFIVTYLIGHWIESHTHIDLQFAETND